VSGDGGFYLYVVDDHEHLVGIVPLHRLLAADASTPIRAIRTDEVESGRADTDQEEVARRSSTRTSSRFQSWT
jgi:magnesium transporter